MTIVYDIVLILHFIGLASLLGGFLAQMRAGDKGVNPAMLHGAILQLVTGVILVGLASSGAVSETLNNAVVTIKLLVVVVILILAIVGRRRQATPQPALWGIIGGLTLLNIVIAVLPGVVQG